MPDCVKCKHYEVIYADDSDGWDNRSWPHCGARNSVSNLKQFPFRKTSCAKFQACQEGCEQ